MHCKSPHIELKKIDVQKDSKSSKASHRRKNHEGAQAEKQAKRELKENKAKDLKTDSYPVPDRFKAFTIGDRHLVFDKAQRKPSEGSNTGYDGPAKEVDLADEKEDPKLVFIATNLSHVEEQELLTLL